MSFKINRERYASMFGPTVGDRIRLADTELYIEIEKDHTQYGDEITFGGGKTIRDGGGQDPTVARRDGALDLVITNAVILDWSGIIKADIGIQSGNIVGIGKAGNPKVQDGVTPGMVVGPSTEVIAGENLIVTAGGIDTHIHFICPQLCEYAIASGVTTLMGGGTGPATGTNATTCTPGAWNIHRMYQAADGLPVNLGFFGKGNGSSPKPLIEQIEAGACGLKMHEDWGTTPAVIDACLSACDDMDVQATLHTDTLNESGFVEDTIKALKGRAIHAFHTEGARRPCTGHHPHRRGVIRTAQLYQSHQAVSVNTIEEHLDMLMVCHHLNKSVPEDIAFAESRIRWQTIAAEDVLHDMGAISMFSSDSQAMGRVGEVIIRTWQTADKMKKQRGALSGDSERNDNARVKRYVAKYTINPAITHGIGHIVGSVQTGKFADLVLWKPQCFGVKPEIVIKGSLIATRKWAIQTLPFQQLNQSTCARCLPPSVALSMLLVCTSCLKHAVRKRVYEDLQLRKRAVAVKTAGIGKADMRLNDFIPEIKVNPETFEVFVNGESPRASPQALPLAQRYFLF